MAEYYPLLAKAVGSLPNSTPDTRRIVYERARKALIGQLRTYHPPVPDEDIERESLELDRAIERIETEIAAAPPAPAPAAPPPAPAPAAPPPAPSDAAPKPADPAKAKLLRPKPAPAPTGALGPAVPRKPVPPLRPRMPKPATSDEKAPAAENAQPSSKAPAPLVETGELSSVPKPPATDAVDADTKPASEPKAPAIGLKLPTAKPEVTAAPPPTPPSGPGSADPVPPRPRLEPQRPFAPQPAVAKGPKRRIWIIPAGIAVVVAMIAILAWKIRVKPETVARNTPAQTQPAQDNGKISDRVGGAKPDDSAQTTAQPTTEQPTTEPPATQPAPQDQPAQPTPQEQAAQPDQATQPSSEASKAAPPPASNPEVPVAYRSALLVEAPDLPSKVQTFAGTVVWKLNNVNNGPGDAVGLSVEADIDLPDDKTKVAVIFEKNSDSSLPASHTIKVRFTVGPGSYSGDVKQINVPQMRREGNTDGEPLAGVTVPVVQNSFLVGLSPGNAETANLRLLTDMPWVDIPILLTSGKIAKLTFEKGAAGQRDFAEAAAYWQKQ
ncbi:hypothetical protein RHCH11_RHCH11_02735 [Beijerinckiaceae bacterium RH CH11]|nr:hypothetical protein RHCH11_RHCH11_02735 [Beijerinckiaceae bacterium RH CH11]